MLSPKMCGTPLSSRITVTALPRPGMVTSPEVRGREPRTVDTTTAVVTITATTTTATRPRSTRRTTTARLTLRD